MRDCEGDVEGDVGSDAKERQGEDCEGLSGVFSGRN